MRSIARLLLAGALALALPTAVVAASLSVSGTVSPVAFLDSSTGDLYVIGTISCNKNAQGHVRVVVGQPDIEDTSPSADLDVPCGRNPTVWVARVTGGSYAAGPAALAIGFSATKGSEAVVTGHEEPIVIFPF